MTLSGVLVQASSRGPCTDGVIRVRGHSIEEQYKLSQVPSSQFPLLSFDEVSDTKHGVIPDIVSFALGAVSSLTKTSLLGILQAIFGAFAVNACV